MCIICEGVAFLDRIEFGDASLGTDVGKGVTIGKVKINCNVFERV
jgi:hypothetical protein